MSIEETTAGHRREELESKHLAELHELAAASGIPRFRVMRRAELIDAMATASGPPKDEAVLDAEPAPVPTGLESPEPQEPEPEPEGDDVDAWAWEPREAPAGHEEVDFERDEADAEREGADAELDEADAERDEADAELAAQFPAEAADGEADTELCVGVLDLVPDGYGFLRVSGLSRSEDDVYVSRAQVQRLNLRRGDELAGSVHRPRRSEQYRSLARIDAVNGVSVDELDSSRPEFEGLTPVGAGERLELQCGPADLDSRMADLLAPIGKGQRALIAAPPGAGATRLLQQIARAIASSDAMSIVVLLDARPEEVSDWQRSVDVPIHASGPESSAEAHVQIAQLAVERAKRLAEQGIDVVLLLDSLTRLARARALSRPRARRGRGDAEERERDQTPAIQGARRFFSAGRNTEEQGSLTMLCTVRTGSDSSMEEMIYDALSDSANLELRLGRELALRGLWPALEVGRCQSRSEEATLSQEELEGLRELRSRLARLSPSDAWLALAERVRGTDSNRDLLRAAGRES